MRIKEDARRKKCELVTAFNFVDDGTVMVDPRDAFEAFGVRVPTSNMWNDRRLVLKEAVQQYVHSAGLLFVHIMYDENGWALFALMENRRYIGVYVYPLCSRNSASILPCSLRPKVSVDSVCKTWLRNEIMSEKVPNEIKSFRCVQSCIQKRHLTHIVCDHHHQQQCPSNVLFS